MNDFKLKTTKGIWTFGRCGEEGDEWPNKRWGVVTRGGHTICISPRFFTDGEESEANGKLIACAPALLECLIEAGLQIQYLHEKFKETGSGNAVLSRIDSLIEKATK